MVGPPSLFGCLFFPPEAAPWASLDEPDPWANDMGEVINWVGRCFFVGSILKLPLLTISNRSHAICGAEFTPPLLSLEPKSDANHRLSVGFVLVLFSTEDTNFPPENRRILIFNLSSLAPFIVQCNSPLFFNSSPRNKSAKLLNQ